MKKLRSDEENSLVDYKIGMVMRHKRFVYTLKSVIISCLCCYHFVVKCSPLSKRRMNLPV